jgi:uncharacterized protein YjbI with pentapeptide repeats
MCLRTVTIKAIDAVKSIREGMDDAALMERYNICAQGLQSLFRQLEAAGILKRAELERRSSLSLSEPSVALDVNRAAFAITNPKKPVINAAEAVQLIREGMDDAVLMKKYRLSIRGVQSLQKKLLAKGLLREEDIKNRTTPATDLVVVEEECQVRRASADEIDVSGLMGRVQSGARQKDLMEEYNVSATTLGRALKKLIAQGLLTQTQLESTLPAQPEYFEIRHRETQKIIHKGESCTFAQFVEEAIARRVDLSGANLSGVDLARADLSGGRFCRANFRNACLLGTDFTGANLSKATMVSANLFAAVLYKTNLAGADLSDANLSMVYAMWAFLPSANLAESNLSRANFAGAHLANAHLFESILKETNFTGAYLDGVNLDVARKIGFG